MTTLADDLRLALDIADRVDALTMARFGASDLVVEEKPDLTPVSDADKAAEQLIRDALAAARPEDTIYGEEQGGTLEHTGRRWILDPIDGTKNFVRGVPIWASLIALLEDGVPVVGVVSAPALGRRWWAGRGVGAYAAVGDAEPRRISVSAVAAMSPKPMMASRVRSSKPPATTTFALPSLILSKPSSTDTAAVAQAATGWTIEP